MLSTEFVSNLSCYTETQNLKYLKFCNDYVPVHFSQKN